MGCPTVFPEATPDQPIYLLETIIQDIITHSPEGRKMRASRLQLHYSCPFCLCSLGLNFKPESLLRDNLVDLVLEWSESYNDS